VASLYSIYKAESQRGRLIVFLYLKCYYKRMMTSRLFSTLVADEAGRKDKNKMHFVSSKDSFWILRKKFS